MSETSENMGRMNIRWHLLVTVSALALLASSAGEAQAADNDSDRPLVWIDLGGQLEQFGGQGSPFTPPFVTANDWKAENLTSPAAIQKMNLFSFGEEGGISFQPENSDWIFSGSIRYGRSAGHKFAHQQLKSQTTRFPFASKYLTVHGPSGYAETKAASSETHLIADFQAGKDVGLGMFGHDSTSTLSLGVRFAQLSSKLNASIRARPDAHFTNVDFFGYQILLPAYHEYFSTGQRAASFRGFGPSISWNASVPLAGNPQDDEITFDWGANAAMLFGKQRIKTHHHTTGSYHYRKGLFYGSTVVSQLTLGMGGRNSSRSVVVPNVGGFAGLSFRYSDAKVSFGYRGDFFFGAMDTGFDARKSETRGYYGPYASISFGLGD